MQSKTLILYASKYGVTRQYAEWLAEAVCGDCLPVSKARPDMLAAYSTVIFGGGLYASSISGIAFVIKNAARCQRLAVFTVGLTDPSLINHAEIVNHNLPPELRDTTAVFHLHGGIDYARLSLPHKLILAAAKKLAAKAPNDSPVAMLPEQAANFAAKEALAPLIAFAQTHVSG